ncbi:MAG TPA: DEAD/DEAH box helicase [Acidimicrobiales bacterium]|nr:DEAD/DEAH box helicase [Acidimicrobiales bacterium]
MSGTRDRFLEGLGFTPDPFQLHAIDALDAGRSVLVAAPTGSGKTVVAEYAIAKALAEGRKAFYTTPLKALSNQKYGDLVRAHGPDGVGLLTGDNAINGDAPVVVMTTEVLRNMIYAGSAALHGLRYVVLDEVHYLQNPYRGAVWEEVIVHTPPEVDLVCLSATVSNAEEFADWVGTVRGATTAVIEERRPVELQHLYLVGDRFSERLHLLPTFVDGSPNPEAANLDNRALRGPDTRSRARRGRFSTPRRAETVERLFDEDMLPAIFFIFSRAACDDAVRQCLDDGLRLTTPDDRAAIRAIAEAKVASLSDADLDVLGYDSWLAGMESGLAAHHAGLVPPFKEAVEACFSTALVKVVFATETLSLGINMPARSVVIEKLTKFTGERHEPLTPGEYTQFTGRAGRRGIDEVGYAVVLWSPFVPFDQVAGLASTRTYALSSSFRPTYNMAANLVRRYPADVAHHLLNLSFAQYRADADVVRLEAQLERNRQALVEARERAACHLGDVAEYRSLQRKPPPSPDGAVAEALARVRPGDVLVVPGGKSAGRVAVLATSQRRGADVRVTALTPDRRRVSLSPRDFRSPPRPRARVELPVPYAPASRTFQRSVAQALAKARLSGGEEHGDRAERPSPHRHPVAACPDARGHLRAAERVERLERDGAWLERRIQGRTESLARQFDRVLRVLEAWGYVDGWSLTDAGRRLTRLYHECDLLVAEAVGAGLFDDLDAPSVAGLASVFTYEHRRPGPQSSPRFPNGEVRRRWHAVEELAKELQGAEKDAGLPLTREPDPGFVDAASAWASGDALEEVMADDDMSGGDFVRNVKQLIDLLRQLGDASPTPSTASAARAAAEQLFRGVVAASSVVGTGPAAAAPAPDVAPGAVGR